MDMELESRIEQVFRDLINGGITQIEQIELAKRLAALVAQRSPQAVEEIEHKRGLTS